MGIKKKNPKVVMVSGGFDPLHIGHIRYMKEAKSLGDKLVVVINNDNWLRQKKGKAFMHENDRKEIIQALDCVDEVIISGHSKNSKDRSVCSEIELLRPHIFANGGDRFADNIPEFQICQKLGIDMVFNVGHGGKVRSSSELLAKYLEEEQKKSRKTKKRRG